MKVASRGPIVRWALRRPTTGVVVSRDDWRGGRSLEEEEKAAGLFVRLREACASSLGTCSRECKPLVAVVKAQPSDFQVNEVDALGRCAVLEKCAKGRWKKVSRQKTILVEDDSRTPFSDPSKTFSPRVQSYGEYVRLAGRLPRDTPVLHFVVYRDFHSLGAVENRLRYVLGLQRDCIVLQEPPGGSFGCVTQHGLCIGVTKELLLHASRHYNTHPLVFDPREYRDADSLAAPVQRPRGNHYRILLRCVEGDKEQVSHLLKTTSDQGFINYFGIEHFGVGTNRLFDMASLAARGEYRQAIGSLLHCVAECNVVHHEHYLRYLNAHPSTLAGVAQSWAGAAKHMRAHKWVVDLLQGLAAYHAEPKTEDVTRLGELWKKLPMHDQIKRSAAEFVWNAMASQRVISHGLRVREGDVVRLHRPVDGSMLPGSVHNLYHVVSRAEEEQGAFHITDVVLPVPYGIAACEQSLFPQLTPLDRDLYREFAEKHHLEFLFSDSLSPPLYGSLEFYRPLVVKPDHLQLAVLHDPNSFTSLKSDLFMMQERRPVQAGEMDYTARVREPCVYNVSERFVEKMEPVLKAHSGPYTVVLSFFLPDGASPLVMLRESFSLHYASFQDMYCVS
ncbi:hypothetical protein ERJ75_000824800 [Trypanosoma vivax]|nr:hypothetical protein ERJ75_000824800 [Trypanosoma vivax]